MLRVFALAFLIFLTFEPEFTRAQEPPKQLVGTWRLMSWWSTPMDGILKMESGAMGKCATSELAKQEDR